MMSLFTWESYCSHTHHFALSVCLASLTRREEDDPRRRTVQLYLLDRRTSLSYAKSHARTHTHTHIHRERAHTHLPGYTRRKLG